MSGIIAPPKMIVKNRKVEFADIEAFSLKTGDKWFDTANEKAYFFVRKPWTNGGMVACVVSMVT